MHEQAGTLGFVGRGVTPMFGAQCHRKERSLRRSSLTFGKSFAAMVTTRAMLLWLAIIPFAIANGILRDRLFNPMIGPDVARLCSGVILSLAIFAWTLMTIGWIGRLQSSGYVAIGALWLILTVTFEFVFGRLVAKHSWEQLLRPYRFENGDIWPIVLAVVAVSPFLAAKIRRHR